ncbi:MAG: VOC family protein [Sphingobium sp.]
MANKPGDFIWYELMTGDADAAQRFYGAILGWTFDGNYPADVDYRIISAGDHGVGGILPISPDMAAQGARPIWVGYILVEDVESAASSITAAGGAMLMPAKDVPQAGRIAMMSDPQGIPFYIIRPAGEGDSLAFAYDKPRAGHCAWNELITPDPASALSFYTTQFGWEKDGEMDMGPMGQYEFLRHGSVIGALMPKSPEMPHGGWNHYFRVADVDEAVRIVGEEGGTVLFGPQEVPGGDWVIQGLDPQGAAFALVGSRVAKETGG